MTRASTWGRLQTTLTRHTVGEQVTQQPASVGAPPAHLPDHRPGPPDCCEVPDQPSRRDSSAVARSMRALARAQAADRLQQPHRRTRTAVQRSDRLIQVHPVPAQRRAALQQLGQQRPVHRRRRATPAPDNDRPAAATYPVGVNPASSAAARTDASSTSSYNTFNAFRRPGKRCARSRTNARPLSGSRLALHHRRRWQLACRLGQPFHHTTPCRRTRPTRHHW
jgi:hypothetical protein